MIATQRKRIAQIYRKLQEEKDRKREIQRKKKAYEQLVLGIQEQAIYQKSNTLNRFSKALTTEFEQKAKQADLEIALSQRAFEIEEDAY